MAERPSRVRAGSVGPLINRQLLRQWASTARVSRHCTQRAHGVSDDRFTGVLHQQLILRRAKARSERVRRRLDHRPAQKRTVCGRIEVLVISRFEVRARSRDTRMVQRRGIPRLREAHGGRVPDVHQRDRVYPHALDPHG